MCRPVHLTDAVTLRLVEPGDARPLADSHSRNRAHLAPWEPARTEEFFTEAWQEADIPRLLESHRAGSGLPLVLAGGDEILGRVMLTGITRGALQSASLGYWIDAGHAGRGIMSAALEAVLTMARDDLGLHRVQAETLIHNHASQRALFRAGFERIGLAPRYLRIAGTWQDHELFQRILHE